MLETFLSFVAITILAVLSYALGQWRDASLGSADEIRNRLTKTDKTFDAEKVFLSDDGSAAIAIDKNSDRLGLVRVFGDHYATRIMTRADISNLESSNEESGRIQVQTKDTTFPRIELRLDDESHRNELLERMIVSRRETSR